MAIVRDYISTGHNTTLNNEGPLEFVFEARWLLDLLSKCYLKVELGRTLSTSPTAGIYLITSKLAVWNAMQPNVQAKRVLTAQSSLGTWYCILSRFYILIGQCADEQHSGEHISGHLPIQSLFVMLAGLQGSYMHGWNGCPKCGRRILRTCTTPPRTRLWTKDIHRFSSTVELGEASLWYSNGRTSDIKQDWYEAHADQDLARPSHRWPECIIQPISSKSMLKISFCNILVWRRSLRPYVRL